jgi:hypothetical protein
MSVSTPPSLLWSHNSRTFPVEIPQPLGRKSKVPKEVNHDTMLLIKFRSKRAREEWTATKEWREFMGED